MLYLPAINYQSGRIGGPSAAELIRAGHVNSNGV
jgi:hypothetical protein